MTEFERRFEEEFIKQKNEVQKPNIVVVGGTGMGKSSLINLIFGDNVATTGEGKPVTKGIDRYEPQNIPVIFYDTEGYEISKDGSINRNNFVTYVIPELERMNSGDLKNHVHIVWYCISVAGDRVTDYDKLNIQYFLNKHMKVALVFTQLDKDDYTNNNEGLGFLAIKKEILKIFPAIKCFKTSIKEELKLDLEALIDWSSASLPNEQLRHSFIASQKMSINSKKAQAYKIVSMFVGMTATTAGLNPFPISDAFLLVPQQITMCVQITNIFWINTGLSEMIMDLLKTQIVTLAGKQIAASLAKLIPGFGQVVNAIVAGGITGGLGATLIEGNAKAFLEFLETGKLPDWSAIFSSKSFFNSVKGAIKNKTWEIED